MIKLIILLLILVIIFDITFFTDEELPLNTKDRILSILGILLFMLMAIILLPLAVIIALIEFICKVDE